MFYNINYMDCGEQNDAHNRTTSCEYVILCGRKGLCRYVKVQDPEMGRLA